MRYGTGQRRTVILLTVCIALTAVPLWACSVPVFRYALERWRADPYRAVIFHRGKLSAEDQALVESLSPDGLAGEKFANIVLEVVDLDSDPDERLQTLWESQKTEELPWMVVQYPAPFEPAWSGALNKQVVDGLLDSLFRREIARRILKGETAVWIFLESGDSKQDDAAFHLLEKRLKYAQANLKLPEVDEQDIAAGLVSVDPLELKVKFSALRLPRDAPGEKMFVEMLLGSEGSGKDSLRDPLYVNKPMAFPIFGRGRVLYGLVGSGINEDTIAIACQELTGPCTCQVKDQNPGIDLVMSVDWDRFISPQIEIDKELPALMGLASFTADAGDTEQPSSLAAKPQAVSPSGPSASVAAVGVSVPMPAAVAGRMSNVLRNTMILIGLCVVGVVGVSVFLVTKK